MMYQEIRQPVQSMLDSMSQNNQNKNTNSFSKLETDSPQTQISQHNKDTIQKDKSSKRKNRKKQKNNYQNARPLPLNIIEISPSKRALSDQLDNEFSKVNYQPCVMEIQDLSPIHKKPVLINQKKIQVHVYEYDQQQHNNQHLLIQKKDKINSQQIKLFNENKLNEKINIFKTNKLTELISFTIPNKYSVKFLIRVNKSIFGGDNYDLFLQEQKKHLLIGHKSSLPMSSTIEIVDPKSKNILYQMYKNFTGTQYILFNKDTAKQLAWVSYTPNLFGLSGQRTMLAIKTNGQIPLSNRFSDIKNNWENEDRKKLIVMTSRLAQLKKGVYELDFHGKIKEPSRKNIILEDDNGKQCLLFGKKCENVYIMQVSSPLSLLQAFAISISNLDSKLLVH